MQKVKIRPFIDDRIFAFDRSVNETFYLLQADEAISITDGIVSSVPVASVNETLDMREEVSPQFSVWGLATESLVFADITAFVHDALIEEGLSMEDVELSRWVFNVLVECGCDIADIIG